MKKLLLGIFLLPLLCSFSFAHKNIENTIIRAEYPAVCRVLRSSESDNFISYWNNDFRVNNPKVCDITSDAFYPMYDRYIALSKEDRQIVNSTIDNLEPDYTIGDIIKTLVGKFYPNNKKSKNEKKKLDQSAIIIIAVVVALVGATSISILFILKNQKVIK